MHKNMMISHNMIELKALVAQKVICGSISSLIIVKMSASQKRLIEAWVLRTPVLTAGPPNLIV